jgi:hypothetical protein
MLCVCTVFMSAISKPKLYNPRHAERTLLYQTVAEHYETWLELSSAGQFDWQGEHHSPKPYVLHKPSRSIWNAAYPRTALPALGATTADTTSWWPSLVKAGARAPHAPRGAWSIRRRT